MIVNYTSLTGGYTRQPNSFGTQLIKHTQAVKRAKELATEIEQKIQFGTIGMVGLGNGSLNFFHDVTQAETLRERAIMRVTLGGLSRTVDLALALERAAEVFQWNVFRADNIVLLDEEKTTGRSLSTVYHFLRTRLGLRDEQIWTACLINRSDCELPEYHIPLDFTGFRVYGSRPGILYGYGMDIDGFYGTDPGIWYTVRANGTGLRQPRRSEHPRVDVPGSPSDVTLDEWWKWRREVHD